MLSFQKILLSLNQNFEFYGSFFMHFEMFYFSKGSLSIKTEQFFCFQLLLN